MADVIRSDSENMTGFDVHDVGLAAALMCVGHELVTLHPDEECGCEIFHFEATPLVEQDAEAYWKNKLSVDAKNHWVACEYLLDRLFGDLQDEN